MTLQDIEQAIYRRCGYADAPAAEVITRIRQWINIWHQRLLARPGMSLLRDLPTASFTTVTNQGQYTLPASVRRVMKISESTTPTALRMETMWWLRETDPQLASKGIPEAWIPVTWQLTTPPLPQLIIQLWPIPAGPLTYTVDTQNPASDMAATSDEPLLPFEYHWLLVEAGCYEEWLRKADARAGTARQDMEVGFKEMRHWLHNPYDYQPTNLPSGHTPSRLGGMYPSW